jgi:hypothetical protein
MICKIENLLIIGSTQRKSGKTRLCLSLLDRYATIMNIAVIKIATESHAEFQKKHGSIRYSCLNGDISDIGKDSAQFLLHGAQQSFYIETTTDYILSAFLETIHKLPTHYAIICESNTLRRFVEPDRFVMVGNVRSNIKPSAKEVISFANIIFNDTNYDNNDIVYDNNRWRLR